MLPIRDNVQARRVPIVTVGLIAANVVVFGLCAMMPERQLEAFFFQYGLIPAKIFEPTLVARYYHYRLGMVVPNEYTLGESLLPILTCMFLHGGIVHVAGNMWMLWIFGDNVEDCLGHVGFLLFYLACGLTSSITHAVVWSHSPVATIGASGAVAGVMGAYLLLYPQARIWTFIWFFFFVDIWAIPAFVFLFYWFAIQLMSGVAAVGASDILAGGVAWWAHVGGFVAGALFVLFAGVRSAPRYVSTYRRRHY